MFSRISTVSSLLFAVLRVADSIPFRPCPLLGPRFPIPRHTIDSAIIRQGTKNLTDALDAYVTAADGDFGPITPNTTSFSVTMFSTEESDSTDPFFYEYHHSSNLNASVDSHTVLPVGDLTTMFTVWLFLIEAGEEHWSDPVSRWIPELDMNSTSANHWDEITLGDLAGHLSGIGRYSPNQEQLDPMFAPYLQGVANDTDSICEMGLQPCDRAHFLSFVRNHAPIFSSASTPIFSNTAFILLSYALQEITGRSFSDMLNASILHPLNMTSTSLSIALNKHSIPFYQSSKFLAIEAPFNGLLSSIHDISTALRAILASHLLAPAVTNRWLKPVSHTSNRANSVGRPWEIYSLAVDNRPSPIIPVYQVRGNVDAYTTHIGLVPDYNVGFAIMAVDGSGNADMNAIADIVAGAMIPALEGNAIAQANRVFAGTYTAEIGEGQNSTVVKLTIASAADSSAGLSVTNFTLGSQDLRAVYARMQDIEPDNLSMRLYPTGLVRETESGTNKAFRAVFQDEAALADAGTPTCETWRYVDKLQYRGIALDEFVFGMEVERAVGVDVTAIGVRLRRNEE